MYFNIKSLKKGAMFGLDARIALAIFGALSVISGAALYSAIQSSKAEAFRQYFVEFIKATEAYYLDNYTQLPVANSTYLWLYTPDLVINRENLNSWEGPYLNHINTNSTAIMNRTTAQFDVNAHMRIWLRTKSTWAEMNDLDTDGMCVVDSSDCAEWLVLYGGNTSQDARLLQEFNNLDDLVDGGDGELSGTVRYSRRSPSAIMYQGLARKRK